MAILSATDLVTGYGRQRAHVTRVSSIPSLTIESGTLTCLLGPNGAGKSTLLRTMCGLQLPLAGSVEIGSRAIASLSPKERATLVTYLAAEPPPPVPISVYEYVALGRHPHTGWLGHLSREDRRVIDQAIADVGLGAFIDRDVVRLSDGERQRVSLARGLAQATRVLLLDEPTAHLDVAQRCVLAGRLRAVTERDGVAVVVSTHDLDFAMRMADRLWLLNADGSLAADCPAAVVERRMIDAVFGLQNAEGAAT